MRQRECPKWRSSLGPSPWSSRNPVEKVEREKCGIQMGRGYHENTVHRLHLDRAHRAQVRNSKQDPPFTITKLGLSGEMADLKQWLKRYKMILKISFRKQDSVFPKSYKTCAGVCQKAMEATWKGTPSPKWSIKINDHLLNNASFRHQQTCNWTSSLVGNEVFYVVLYCFLANIHWLQGKDESFMRKSRMMSVEGLKEAQYHCVKARKQDMAYFLCILTNTQPMNPITGKLPWGFVQETLSLTLEICGLA